MEIKVLSIMLAKMLEVHLQHTFPKAHPRVGPKGRRPLEAASLGVQQANISQHTPPTWFLAGGCWVPGFSTFRLIPMHPSIGTGQFHVGNLRSSNCRTGPLKRLRWARLISCRLLSCMLLGQTPPDSCLSRKADDLCNGRSIFAHCGKTISGVARTHSKNRS